MRRAIPAQFRRNSGAILRNPAQFCAIRRNYSETCPPLLRYRDIVFYAKYFLNPQLSRFPPKSPHTQRDAELMFAWDSNNLRFQITAYGDTPLICRPKLKRGEVPPLHRFTDLANPSEYTQPQFIESEDCLLYTSPSPRDRQKSRMPSSA